MAPAVNQPPASNPQHRGETTNLRGIILFYASCAGVSAGAGMAAMGFLLFTDEFYAGVSMFLKIAGVILCVGGIVGAFVFLGAARKV